MGSIDRSMGHGHDRCIWSSAARWHGSINFHLHINKNLNQSNKGINNGGTWDLRAAAATCGEQDRALWQVSTDGDVLTCIISNLRASLMNDDII